MRNNLLSTTVTFRYILNILYISLCIYSLGSLLFFFVKIRGCHFVFCLAETIVMNKYPKLREWFKVIRESEQLFELNR